MAYPPKLERKKIELPLRREDVLKWITACAEGGDNYDCMKCPLYCKDQANHTIVFYCDTQDIKLPRSFDEFETTTLERWADCIIEQYGDPLYEDFIKVSKKETEDEDSEI
jgi:hypothetical protein